MIERAARLVSKNMEIALPRTYEVTTASKLVVTISHYGRTGGKFGES